MLLDTIATIILAGMMLIPIVNLLVGAIVGAGIAGLPGSLLGLVVAIGVMALEKLAADRRRTDAARDITAEVTAAGPVEVRVGMRRMMMRTRPLPMLHRLPMRFGQAPERYTLH